MALLLRALCLVLFSTACSLDVGGQGEEPTQQTPDPIAGEDGGAVDAAIAHDAGRGDSEGDDAAAPVPEDASAEVDAAEPEPEPSDVLVGHYAGKRTFRTLQRIQSAIFQSDVKVLNTGFSLASITKRDGAYYFRERQCRTQIETSGNFFTQIDVTLDDAVPRSADAVESELAILGDDITKPLTHVPVGFRAATIADVLPTQAMDPRVFDADLDGKPGVTVHVRAGIGVDGDAYVVQWSRTRYELTRDVQTGELAGENFDRTEQRVVATSPGDGVLAMVENQDEDPNTADNRVRFVRLDGELDCDELLVREAQLF